MQGFARFLKNEIKKGYVKLPPDTKLSFRACSDSDQAVQMLLLAISHPIEFSGKTQKFKKDFKALIKETFKQVCEAGYEFELIWKSRNSNALAHQAARLCLEVDDDENPTWKTVNQTIRTRDHLEHPAFWDAAKNVKIKFPFKTGKRAEVNL